MKSESACLKNATNFLTDIELLKLSERFDIISPIEKDNLSGCSYDLRVGKSLSSRNLSNNFDISNEPYYIESGEVVTINTLEKIDFRQLLCMGIICNKHSILAKGIFHPMTVIDPGFRGVLAVTFINIGNTPYRINSGDKICKLCIFPTKIKPLNIYGSTQSPSYKEGSLDIANIYNTQSPNDKILDLSKMYGAPLQNIINRIENIENNYSIAELQINAKNRKEVSQNYRSLVIALIAGAFGAFISIYWKDFWTLISPHLPVITF